MEEFSSSSFIFHENEELFFSYNFKQVRLTSWVVAQLISFVFKRNSEKCFVEKPNALPVIRSRLLLPEINVKVASLSKSFVPNKTGVQQSFI